MVLVISIYSHFAVNPYSAVPAQSGRFIYHAHYSDINEAQVY